MGLPTLPLHINFETAISPKPEAGDFVFLPFRLLSKTIVGSGTWKSTDFSNADVLKQAIPLLEGKPAFTDHYTWGVESAIGVIKNVRWEEAFTDEQGNMIPAGIVGEYVLDTKLGGNTELVRKIVGNPEMGIPPAVNGSSVGIAFEWIPSHNFGDDEMAMRRFKDLVGTMFEGREVTRVVTKITEFRESSLVNFPADKHAKNRIGKYGVKNGNGEFEAVFSFNDDTQEARQLFEEKQTYSVFVENFENPAPAPEEKPTDAPKATQDLSAQLAELQAINARLQAEATERQARFETLQAEVTSLQASQTNLQANVAEYVAQLAQARTERDNFEAKVQELQPRAIIGDARLIELRRATATAYGLAFNGETNKHLLEHIEQADYDTLQALHTQYTQSYQKQHPLTCQSCGKSTLTAQSSVSPQLEALGALEASEASNISERFFNNR